MKVFKLLGTGGAFLLVATTALAFDWPARKAGQWNIQMESQNSTGIPAMDIKMCLDAKTDKDMMESGMALGKSLCPDQTIGKEGETIVIKSTCEVAGMKVVSRTEIAGDFQSE